MSSKNSSLKKALYIIVPILLVVIVIVKLKSNKEVTTKKVYQYDKKEIINVETEVLKLEKLNNDFTYSGTFQADRESKISAELQGKINAFYVDNGDYVQEGQTLIQLDHSLLKLQLQTLEVQIEGLQADIDRYTILAKADAIQGVQLEKSLLALKGVNVQKATLEEQLNKTTIKAPFTGVVTAKMSEIGSFAAPGIPLLQLTDISDLKFTINIAESELRKFKLNQTYTVFADVYNDIPFKGVTQMIGSKANMGGSFPVQFLVKNSSDLKVKAGMFGKVKIESKSDELGIVIPSSIVFGSANSPHVYTVKDGKAVLTPITISKRIEDKIVVLNGLKEGDKIITNGFINLFEGANIKVK